MNEWRFERKFVIDNMTFQQIEDSNLKINNQLLNGDYKNVRGLMYGNVYGTATSRD